MRLFGLKTCDTCRKAEKALRAKGIDLDFVDVRDDPVAATELARFHAAFGGDLLNRRSTTWRALDDSARAGDPLALLAAHPTLMKRPVIDDRGTLYLGWGKEVQNSLLA